MSEQRSGQSTVSTVDLIAEIDRSLDRISATGVTIEQTSEVCDYLKLHSDLLEIAVSICTGSRARFSKSTQIALALYVDPEIDDRYLTLYIRPETYEDGIIAEIERFAADYESQFNGKSGAVFVNTDFRTAQISDAY